MGDAHIEEDLVIISRTVPQYTCSIALTGRWHKDTAVEILVPQLAPEWDRELQAESGWQDFKLADFERLKREFGVDWVIVRYPELTGLNCEWHNGELAVCQIE